MSYDDFDGAVNEPVQAELGDTESMLEEVIHMIASAPNVPLSSTPRIDRDHVVGLLQALWQFFLKKFAKHVGC